MVTEFTDDPLHAAIPGRDTQATALDQSDTSATQTLYRSALGGLRVDYYGRVFARFDAQDRSGPSWNWAAALLTLNWMAFRQLWGAALAYAGAMVVAVLVLFGMGRLLFGLSAEAQAGLLVGIGVLSIVLPGMYGNALLYQHCHSRMEHALAANTTLPEACTMLNRQASSRQRLFWLALLNAALAGLAIAVVLALPDVGELPLHSEKMAQARNTPDRSGIGQSGLATVAIAPASSAASAPLPATASSGTATATATAATAASAPASDSTGTALGPQASGPAPVATGRVTSMEPAATASAAASQPHPAAAARLAQGKIQNATPAAPAKAAAMAPRSASSSALRDTAQPPADASTGANASANTKPNAKSTARAQRKARSASQTVSGAYLINVGLFADANNARNASAKLEDAHLPAQRTEFNSPKGKRTRVRAGPFDSQAEADAAAEKIHALGLDAVVIPQP